MTTGKELFITFVEGALNKLEVTRNEDFALEKTARQEKQICKIKVLYSETTAAKYSKGTLASEEFLVDFQQTGKEAGPRRKMTFNLNPPKGFPEYLVTIHLTIVPESTDESSKYSKASEIAKSIKDFYKRVATGKKEESPSNSLIGVSFIATWIWSEGNGLQPTSTSREHYKPRSFSFLGWDIGKKGVKLRLSSTT
ncbi:MAG: hypothetical protein JSR76_01825 [Verrucomicrobia bacterium]|nr:hypothetical protein [Verrucomicrobiota bacterium]